MKYYQLTLDDRNDNVWYLPSPLDSSGKEIDYDWIFSSGRSLEPNPELVVPIENGVELDISFSAFVIYLKKPVANIFGEFAPDDIQLVPCKLEDGRPIYILNTLRKIDCLDHKRSALTYKSSKSKKPNMVIELVIDERKVPDDVHVFRITDWNVALIVSEKIVDALESINASGWQAIPVTR